METSGPQSCLHQSLLYVVEIDEHSQLSDDNHLGLEMHS